MKRALFVTAEFPKSFESAVNGIFNRMRMFLEALDMAGYTLDILFYISQDLKITDELTRQVSDDIKTFWNLDCNVVLCNVSDEENSHGFYNHYIKPVFNAFANPLYNDKLTEKQIKAFEACLDKQPALLFIHRLYSAPPILLSGRKLPPCLFDMDDVEHVKFYRSILSPPVWLSKKLYYLHLPALMALEKKVIKLSQLTFVCSNIDKTYLDKKYRLPGITYITNSAESPPAGFSNNQNAQYKLMFIGSYAYEPNRQAANHLIQNIWPMVKKQVADAELVIAGNKPELIDSFSSPPDGVSFTGFVNDLHDLYSNINVVCCPILVGGGTRIKIIEAALHGKPVVATKIGAEGLELENGKEIILQETPDRIADACIQLLRNYEKAKEIGNNAKNKANSLYERNSVIKNIVNVIDSSTLK